MNLWDGQGIDTATQGLPGPVETVHARAGADADAIMALATPTQSTSNAPSVDLEFQLPPDVQTDGAAQSNCAGIGKQILVALVVALLVDWVVR